MKQIQSRIVRAILLAVLPLVLFFGQFQFASAQCPPDETGCTWSAWSSNITIQGSVPDCEITYQYRTRWCNGQMDIDYTIISAFGNCANGMTASALKEYLELIIIQQKMQNAFDGNSVTIPDCDDPGAPSVQAVTFYTASCGIWLSCTYTIEPQEPECESPLTPPAPGPTTVKTWTWQSCGTQCCKNVYNICKGTSVIGGDVIYIRNVSRRQVETPCSDQATFSKPCDSGC